MAEPGSDTSAPRGLSAAASLPGWAARGLAGLLFVGALALPWVATWQGVLARPGPAQVGPELVQYRPELVLVPGGRFRMGSSQAEREKFKQGLWQRMGWQHEDEHDAEVAPLYVCRTEVTLGQWKAVMGTSPNDCNFGCLDDHPAANVTWNDACHYMVELTRRENEVLRKRGASELTPCYEQTGDSWTWTDPACTGFRLPTETEWEYFARASTSTAYFFGDDPKDMCKNGNGGDLAAKAKHPYWNPQDRDGPMFDCDDKFPDLAPVGSFTENPWGLHDVHGNALEWVWDWYGTEAKATALGYAGPAAGTQRVLRGGSFKNGSQWLRAAFRVWNLPSDLDRGVGLRCVRGAPQELAD